MEDSRWLLKAPHGPFTVQQLYRMVERRKVDNRTLFWSERRQQWLSLVHLLKDIYPNDEKLHQMRGCGIKRVQVIGCGAGWEHRSCKQCGELSERTFPIDLAPELPPDGCTCTPWCGCSIIAIR